jgi:hypothetical protein
LLNGHSISETALLEELPEEELPSLLELLLEETSLEDEPALLLFSSSGLPLSDEHAKNANAIKIIIINKFLAFIQQPPMF